MKKLTVMLFASVMVSLLSCSKDNDNKGGNGSNNNDPAFVEKQWMIMEKGTMKENGEIEWTAINNPCAPVEMNFTKDKKVSIKSYEDNCDELIISLDWKLNGEILTLSKSKVEPTKNTEEELKFEIINLNEGIFELKNLNPGSLKLDSEPENKDYIRLVTVTPYR